MLAAMLMVNAKIAVLNANERIDWNMTSRRMACVDTLISAVWDATAIVNAK